MISMNKWSVISIDLYIVVVGLFLLTTIIFTFKFRNNRKKAMKYWGIGWVLLLFVLLATGSLGKYVKIDDANKITYSKKELTKDLNQLEEIIMNENPLYFANKDELDIKFTNASSQIKNGMTELDFYRLINPIVVDVGCGHTNLYISEGLEENRKNSARFFPLKVTLVNDELYLLEEDKENDIVSGDKIISINGKTTGEIINTLIENISIDSQIESKAKYIISKHFNNKFYDFVDNSDTFKVEIKDEKGNYRTVNLEGKNRDDFNTNAWSLHFSDFKNGDYYRTEIFDNYALLDLNIFMSEKDKNFDEFLDEFFQEINNKGITDLVIDIRGNFGGNPKMAKVLLSHFISEEVDYFDDNLGFAQKIVGYQKPISPSKIQYNGDLVVLTDGAVFSTSAHFTAFVKYHKLATIVGSESGGTYVCTDSSKDAVLDNTRIRLHYSTFTYKLAVEGLSEKSGIIPDKTISPTIDDILNNKDIVMEQGLGMLED